MLQVIWGDDEHTAADGPYVRVLKTRKWVYLATAMLLLVAGGWYQPGALTKRIGGILQIADELVLLPLFLGLLYLTLQYAFLTAQLVMSYRIVLKERLAFRREDDLSAARDRAAEARGEVSSVFKSIGEQSAETKRQREQEVKDSRRALEEFHALADDALLNPTALDRRETLLSRLRAAENALNRADWVVLDPTMTPEFRAAKENADRLEKVFLDIAKDDPARSRGYRWMERAVDAIRVFPPIAVGLYGLGRGVLVLF